MKSKNIINELKFNMEFYKPVEQKIAKEIIASSDSFITYSMAALSKKIGVSQGSINNFAKKVCGGGFSELKLQLAKQMYQHIDLPFSTTEKTDGIKDILNTSINNLFQSFKNTYDVNEEETLKNAADSILNANRIELYGIYHSGIAASNFSFQLMQLGLPATFVSDVLMAPISASMLDDKSVVIAISSSGKTKDILDAVKEAKKNNARIVSITSNKTSPLAKLSDYVLLVASSGTSITSGISEHRLCKSLIIDCICTYIRNIIDENGQKQYYRIKSILESHSVND